MTRRVLMAADTVGGVWTYALGLIRALPEVEKEFENDVRHADAVIVGSCVPQGIEGGEWVVETAQGVRAFYDIDTPVTLAKRSGATSSTSSGATTAISPSKVVGGGVKNPR